MIFAPAVHLVQGLCGMVSRKKKRCVAASAFTADCPPPTKPVPLKEKGSYCMFASSHLYDNINNETRYIVGGYDENPDIAAKVDRACLRVQENFNKTVEQSRYECREHRLFFLGEREPCNGEVYLMSKNKDIISYLNERSGF